MAGDFSRRVFDRRKHYAAVLMQQGRVQLDGDWNHQTAIQQHRDRREARDIIGPCGAPKKGGGFAIGVSPDGHDLTISPGSMYVDGLLCELDAAAVPVAFVAQPDTVHLDSLTVDDRDLQASEWVEIFVAEAPLASPPMSSPPLSSPPAAHSRVYRITSIDTAQKTLKLDASVAEFQSSKGPRLRRVATYTSQPDYPQPEFTTASSPPSSPPAAPVLQLADGTYVAYLETWQMEINAGVDRRLREVALGGADTVVALKNTSQVHLLRVTPGGGPPPTCDSSFPEWEQRIAPPTGMMNARTNAQQPPTDPCSLPPTSGYRRLENQLYRVQIHKGGTRSQATFKWSRENSSIETAVEKVSGSVLTVSSLGRDEVLGFKSSQWIEPLDDVSELSGSSRPLAKIDHIDDETREITLAGGPSVQTSPRLRIRRWDHDPALGDQNGIAMTAAWQDLEAGVQVRFSDGLYHAGDYWTIPARTATGEIEWPPFSIPNVAPIPQSPAGTRHHYCRLALVEVVAGVVSAKDCRPLFPPLTHICAEDICYDNTVCNMPGVKTVKDALDHLCQQHAEPPEPDEPAIHITRVDLLAGQTLRNDTAIPIALLTRGIRVLCDRDVFQNSVKDKPVCSLTLEMPFPFNSADRQIWGDAVVGFQPLILFASTDAAGPVISWIPEAPTREFLKALRAQMLDLRRGDQILARLKLRGNFIWDRENRNGYLDGEAFGFARGSTTDIHFPTGDKHRGGDFDMWFWLTVKAGALLKVARVRFLKVRRGREDDPNAPVVAELREPAQPLFIRAEEGVNCMEIVFSGADLDFDSVKLGSSIRVTEHSGRRPPNEQIIRMPANAIRYVVDGFPEGGYAVELFGDQPSPIRSVDGDPLDGDPRSLPSGNDQPGGNFTFALETRFG